jgi:hypothetical protein
MGDKKIAWNPLVGVLREREHLQDPQRRKKEKKASEYEETKLRI